MPSDFRGPMAKQQRMFCVTITCVACAVPPAQTYLWNLPAIALTVICAGCVVTICRRLAGITKNLRGEP
jgi:hypothetical protein